MANMPNRIRTLAIETKGRKTDLDRLILQIANQEGIQEGEAGIGSQHEDAFWLARGEAEAAYADEKGPLYQKLVANGFPRCKDASQFFENLTGYIATQATPRYRRDAHTRFNDALKALTDAARTKLSPDNLYPLFLTFEKRAWELVGIAPEPVAAALVAM